MKSKTEWINFRVSSDVKKFLVQRASDQGRNLSNLVTRIVNNYVNKEQVNTPLPTEDHRG